MLNCILLEQHLGLPAFTSTAGALEYAHACMHLYAQWRPLLAGCDKRDLGVGEEAIELACGALFAAFFISKDRIYIVQVSIVLFLQLSELACPNKYTDLLARPTTARLTCREWSMTNGTSAWRSFEQTALRSLAHTAVPVSKRTECTTSVPGMELVLSEHVWRLN